MNVSGVVVFGGSINGGLEKGSLHKAIRENRPIQEISSLIDPHTINERVDGMTALHGAVLESNVDAIAILLKKGADPFIASENTGNTCFHLAAGYPVALAALKCAYISHGQLELTNKFGATALYNAVESGCYDTAQMLLELGANPNAKCGPMEVTALHVAATNGHAACIKLFKGMDLEEKTKNGKTALYLACQRGKSEAAKVLLELGARPDVKCEEDDTALHAAAANGHEMCVWLFAGMDKRIIEARTKNGATAFFLACMAGKHGAAKALLDLGARTDVRCEVDDATALHVAAATGHEMCVELFEGMPKLIEAKTKSGATALHRASAKKKPAAVAALLKIGASLKQLPKPCNYCEEVIKVYLQHQQSKLDQCMQMMSQQCSEEHFLMQQNELLDCVLDQIILESMFQMPNANKITEEIAVSNRERCFELVDCLVTRQSAELVRIVERMKKLDHEFQDEECMAVLEGISFYHLLISSLKDSIYSYKVACAMEGLPDLFIPLKLVIGRQLQYTLEQVENVPDGQEMQLIEKIDAICLHLEKQQMLHTTIFTDFMNRPFDQFIRNSIDSYQELRRKCMSRIHSQTVNSPEQKIHETDTCSC